MKDWIYDETKHVGVDYSQEENTTVYDEQMVGFRDYEQETKTFLKKLNASNTKDLTAVDIGCGTGAFSIHASRYLKKIYAVDVSKEMLSIVKAKAEAHDIENIEFINSGFLRFQPKEQVDVVFSKWAFHHLSDYWKQAALFNINKMLKPDGLFILSDLVFTCDPDFEKNTDTWLEELSNEFDEEFVEETKIHIRDEFSTFDWILQGLIERAGFKIEESQTDNKLAYEYICRKIKSF